MLQEDDVTNYFSTDKSCVDAAYCCLLLLIARRNAKGRSPHDNPIQGKGVVDVFRNHSQPSTRRRCVVSTTLCLLYAPETPSAHCQTSIHHYCLCNIPFFLQMAEQGPHLHHGNE
jgi:hypothetical protein